jgi:hypothetical protein
MPLGSPISYYEEPLSTERLNLELGEIDLLYEGFQAEYGRPYIGSRDIDVGVHVDADRSGEELRDAPVRRMKRWAMSVTMRWTTV